MRQQLGPRAQEALLGVGVREQAERAAPTDDRQHFELAADTHEVRHGRVPGLVGRDDALLVLGVLDRVREADLLGELGRLDVGPIHRVATVAQRPHQRLVEEVLDHDRRVAEGERRELVAPLLLVELGDVRLLLDVVVDDLAPTGPARHVEMDRAVEPAGAQQRRVERRGTVGRADDEDVRRHRRPLVDLEARGQESVDLRDGPARDLLALGGLVEGLQLDEQLVDDAGETFSEPTRLTMRSSWRASGFVVHSRPRHSDRVDLLDEPDRATLLARRLAQLLEEVGDLAVGLAEVRRLDRARGDEQERHAGLTRHGLGHVRLAGARAGPRRGWPGAGCPPSARGRSCRRGTG